jgi:Protein of unknown function (DUF4235)
MRLLFKPFTMLASVLGGLLASALFTRIWQAATGESDAPAPDSSEHSTREVLLGAVVQGAIFAGVKAAVHRAGARGVRHVTGQIERGAEEARTA